MSLRSTLPVVLLALAAACSTAGGPTVSGAHAPATAGDARVGVVYLQLTNGEAADTLVGVRATNADRVEIHGTTMEQGMMRMRPVAALPLGRREVVRFEPGGLHVMLIGLAKPLRAGDRFTLWLEFERAGAREVPVEVRARG